jgi:Tfp pilus assembly protein PilX
MRKSKLHKNKSGGYAVFITIGIMVVLTIMIITFVVVTNHSLDISYNYLYKVKADYLAEAGIAKTIAELKLKAKNMAVESGNIVFNETLTDAGAYNVTAVDNASKININDQSTNARLSLILQNLNTAIGGSNQLTETDCNNIAANRPYELKTDIMSKAGISKAKFQRIEDFITARGYIDPNTVNPQDVTTPYVLEPRAAVNVNTAPKEVLVAVLTGITARHSCPMCGGDGDHSDSEGNYLDCPYCVGGNISLDATEAGLLADYIIGQRPYSAWDTFYSSIKDFYDGEDDDLTSSKQEVVMANANPNTAFAWCKSAGWASRLGYVGKYVIDINKNSAADNNDKGLTVSTTEFTFSSGGYYTINSTGTAQDENGNDRAESRVETQIKIFDIWNQTTQAQFAAGTLNNIKTHPEPTVSGSDSVDAAVYSGEVTLSKVAKTTPTTFRAMYETTLNADESTGNGMLQNPPNPGSGTQATKPNIASVADFTDRGELMADGMLVDVFDTVCPDYLPGGNLNNDACTMEFWIKTMWPSNDTQMYNDTNFNRTLYRFMSENAIGSNPLELPFETFIFFSRNMGGTSRSCSLGVQGYGFWTGTHWAYYPNIGEGLDCYESYFGINYDDKAYLGNWLPGEWQQIVFTWKEPENSGMCDPSSTGNWPGDYPCDMKIYVNGHLKHNTDWRFHHMPYGGTSPWGYMMIGNEWWSGSGSISHYNQQQVNAVIGSLRIWNHELTYSEIMQEYENGFYNDTGSYSSVIFDPAGYDDVEWGTITWSEAIPTDKEDIKMFVDSGDGWNFVQFWDSPGSGQPINDTSSSIQFKATMTSETISSTQPNKNILINPSFEDGAEIIVAWPQVYGSFRNVPPFAPNLPDGDKCAKCYYDGEIKQTVSITPGKEYKFKASYYIPSGGAETWMWNSYIKVDGGGFAEHWTDLKSSPRNTWNSVETGWITATGSGVLVDIGTWQSGVNPAHPTYFDDFMLLEKGTPTYLPITNSPVLDDVSITYLLPKTEVFYWKHY